MAWLSGWAKRLKITVDKDVIDAALSGFPVPVYISAASGIGDVDASCVFDELTSDANRKKIAVTTSDGETQCPVEIERWDDANEKAWLHVKLPSVSESADTDLYLYYDSTQADNTTYVGDTTDAAAQSVWDSNFSAVYHMGQDPSGGSGAIKDSTSNAMHGTTGGSMTSDDLVDGNFGKGIDFDGSNDYIDIAAGSFLGNSAGSVESIAKLSVDTQIGRIYGEGNAANSPVGCLGFSTESSQKRWQFALNTVSWYACYCTNGIASGTWYGVAATWGAAGMKLYVNGAQDGSNAKTGGNSDAASRQIGRHASGGLPEYFPGIICEVRISDIARSAAWLKATYNGLFDSLLVFGIEEEEPATGWLSGWSKRLKLTIDEDVIDANLTAFPVPIHISAASGIGDVDASCVFDELTSDANRKKIAITKSDGTTQLYVEIESWDDANEQAWLHVKAPYVWDGIDTDLYLYYDSSHADNTAYVGDTTDAAAQAVWDSDFVGVYHMEQDPNGDAANCVKDSTSNANHMTPEGSMTSADLVDGQFGKAIDFDGSNDLLKCADNSTMDFTGGLTAEYLCKGPADTDHLGGQWDTSGSEGNKRSFNINASGANAKLKSVISRTGYDDTAVTITGATDLSSGTWYHLAAWCDLTNTKLFVNGAQDATAAQSAIFNSTDYLTISGLKGVYGTSLAWRSGPIADVRYSKTARSAAWLKATYHGLFDSLLTFGTEEAILTPKEAYHAHLAEKPAAVAEWLHPDPTVLLHYAEKPVLLPLWMHPKDAAHSFYADRPIFKCEVIQPTASILLHYADKPSFREDLTLQDTYHDHLIDQPSLSQNAIPFSSYISVISAYQHLTPEIFPSSSTLLQPVDRPKLSSTAWARVSPPDATWTISQPTATTWTKQ